MATSSMLHARHIQDMNQANATMESHWGYPSRVLPCTKDKGTCEYLDSVYHSHDVSMKYTFILWGVLLGILFVWITLRGWRMGGPTQRVGGLVDSIADGIERMKRRWLLQDAPLRSVFGRVTRLQVMVLAVLSGYLIIFSLVGITYKTWITPIKGSTLHNTRTGFGGWSDRIGALAYALTPFTIMLCMRESVLTMLTGIPYQHFNFLHRWLGRIIFVQSFLHTLGWTIIEGRLYQPQPSTYAGWISQQYMIFGCVAMLFITFLTVFSTKRAIQWTGYEFFKITHWIVAVLYLGACWGHWDKLWCWMVPSLALIAIDQFVRGARILALHVGGGKGTSIGFRKAEAEAKVLGEGDDVVVRLDFDFEHSAWQPGQHFYLTFPSLSIWQAHPYTPSSSPNPRSNVQHHTYIIRTRNGQSGKLAEFANGTIPVILTGPYGKAFPAHDTQNMLAVAGGTGVSFTIPAAIAALRQIIVPQATVDFIWVVRRAADLRWLETEMAELKSMLRNNPGLLISIFVTRESTAQLPYCCNVPAGSPPTALSTDPEKKTDVEVTSASSSSSESDGRSALQQLLAIDQPRFSVSFMGEKHPDMQEIMTSFMERASVAGGCIQVLGSGPEAMGSDLRSAVAKADVSEPLDFYWDSRE